MITLIIFLLLLSAVGMVMVVYFLPKTLKLKIIVAGLFIVVIAGALIFYKIYDAARTLPPSAHIINEYEIDSTLFAGETSMVYGFNFNGETTPLFPNDNTC